EEAATRAAGLRPDVRRPQALGAGARTKVGDQRFGGVILAVQRRLVGVDVRLHEGAVARAQRFELGVHGAWSMPVRAERRGLRAHRRVHPLELLALLGEPLLGPAEVATPLGAQGRDALLELLHALLELGAGRRQRIRAGDRAGGLLGAVAE